MSQGYIPDILKVQEGIIVHQVNCRGKMGAGLAKRIKLAYPRVFERYKEYASRMRPGMIQLVRAGQNLFVCNLAGQDGYGGAQDTDYRAVREGFEKLSRAAHEKGLPVYVPYLMGCGLAGGEWTKYRKLIKESCPNARICCLHFEDMEAYTAPFYSLESLPGGIAPVSIARTTPKALRGKVWDYPKLSPSKRLLAQYKGGKVGQKEYRNVYYRETLAPLGAEGALKDLRWFGKKVVLLCYEKPDDFCHRHIVRDWIEYLTGYKPQEIPER